MKSTRHLLTGLTFALLTLTVHAERYALLVGIDEYDENYVSADYWLYSCVNDALGIYHCLAEDSSLWPSGNMMVLSDNEATWGMIRQRMIILSQQAVSGDTVLYFHSSHGGAHSGTDTYLCAYDQNYEDEDLAEDLARFRDGVKVIVVIDACNSGGLFLSTTEEAPVVSTEWDFAGSVMTQINSLKKTATKSADIGWITAADYDEESWSGTVYSLFANYLIYGFTHGDENGDGVLTFQELNDYAAPRALLNNPGQTAQTYNESVLISTDALSFTIPHDTQVQNAIDQQELEPITVPGPATPWFRNTAISHDGSDAARSGTIGNSETSSFTCRVVGPGTLSFWWRVSCEVDYDWLNLSMDANDLDWITGETSWIRKTLEVGPGEHFITWSYIKDFVTDSGSDCGWVDEIAWTPQQGTPSPALAEAIDNTLLPVFTGGNADYIGQTGTAHDGSDAAKSGSISDGESSWMTVDVIGPGELSFWWRVSSEYGYDMFSFSIDEEHKARISGETSWQQVTYSVGPGTHTLGWGYTKDLYYTITNGFDAGFVDLVDWTGDSDLDNDQLPTNWEINSGLDYTDPTGINGTDGNPDGDRLNNLDEYICGSNPTDASSFSLPAEPIETENPGEHIIQWDSLPGRTYSIYYSSSLTGDSYELLEGGMGYPRNSYTDTVIRAGSSDFYRIDVELTE